MDRLARGFQKAHEDPLCTLGATFPTYRRVFVRPISSHANRVERPRYRTEPKRSLSAIASG